MACPFQLSKDGIEMQFATNHLGENNHLWNINSLKCYPLLNLIQESSNLGEFEQPDETPDIVTKTRSCTYSMPKNPLVMSYLKFNGFIAVLKCRTFFTY